jgi:uncharacterized protein YbdZ (MbtH family)
VKKFIEKNRAKHKIKEYINIQWEEITPLDLTQLENKLNMRLQYEDLNDN